MAFQLNQTLKNDSIFIIELQLCQVRLIDNADFPWLILIPQSSNLVEITDLSDAEYDLLNAEIKLIARTLQNELNPDKLNIATIGNIVSQLHFHIIARYKSDHLFPKPVWGCEFTPYSLDEKKEKIHLFKTSINHML
jgi:diadenosine tetraphosphate (Ap4A) HIT family hydrolase